MMTKLQRKTTNAKTKSGSEQLSESNLPAQAASSRQSYSTEELLQRKDQCIRQLAHNLKAPLTPLMGLLPIIEQEINKTELKDMLHSAIEGVDYMNRLIERTLQLAWLGAPNANLTLEQVDLADEIAAAMPTHSFACDRIDATLINCIKAGVLVRVDRLRFRELMDNLLSNAVKYLGGAGTITIQARLHGSEVIVSVTDTGLGMTHDQLDHIFDEFYRASPNSHRRSSSGLGLSICKRIVETHGGKIWAESLGPNRGTTVYFTLPTVETKPTATR